MKPFLEKIYKPPDASWSMLNRRLEDGIPFQWHHHPEFELTLTLNSRGLRFIGDHVGEYDEGDLVLLGPNLPHTWASRERVRVGEPHVALVLWFDLEWAQRVTAGFVEFRKVDDLLARARRGVEFSSQLSAAVRHEYTSLFEQPPVERLLGLMRVLNDLAQDGSGRPLASDVYRSSQQSDNRERIDRVLAHIHEHYTQELTLQELATRGGAQRVGTAPHVSEACAHERLRIHHAHTGWRCLCATGEHRPAHRPHRGRSRLRHFREFQPAVQAAHVDDTA